MVKDTSIEIYKTIKANGMLSRIEQIVYDTIYFHGPLTMNEVFKINQNIRQTTLSGCFSRMQKRDAILSIGKKRCPISNNVVHIWKTTNNLPKKLDLKPAKCPHCNGTGNIIQKWNGKAEQIELL